MSIKDYLLHVPLDAQKVEDFDPKRQVKVVVKTKDGTFHSQTVSWEKEKTTILRFAFKEHPGSLQVFVGPATASDEEMEGLQTLRFSVSSVEWGKETEFKLAPVIITPYYWRWWWNWCRTITIKGRVVCQDGNGIPGAKVCAYDVDWWWWWISRDQIDCVTTDEDGEFTMTFTWCCWWWPWWWWRRRFWLLEPKLVETILPFLKEIPEIRVLPKPEPKIDLNVFEPILKERFAPFNVNSPLKLASRFADADVDAEAREAFEATIKDLRDTFDLEQLPKLRERLLEVLPSSREFEKLRIWPWYPWYPWQDCSPDVVFKVTQECEGEKTIYNEGFFHARSITGSTYDAGDLVASEDACCRVVPEDPDGNCVDISYICGTQHPTSSIGGNMGAPPMPAAFYGYMNPGDVSRSGDRPYAGTVSIFGNFGSGANTDYYEFQYNDPVGSANWYPVPLDSMAGFSRYYYGPHPTIIDATKLYTAPFPVEYIDGHYVYKSRQYFESQVGPAADWGLGKKYMWNSYNIDMLMPWLTENNFANGLHKLRIKSYQMVGGVLTPLPDILEQCTILPAQDNYVMLRTDNRVNAGSAHRHDCGAGYVHSCTDEPDTEFVAVKIRHADMTEDPVNACGSYSINDTDTLVVDFVAHDPAGHLSYYSLIASFGDSEYQPLLDSTMAGWSLNPGPAALYWAPIAAQVGPDYPAALGDGATAPHWYGGVMRLEMKATEAFPRTCCYQLELRAYKRTIVSCDHDLDGHTNKSEYSFMITVPGT